MKIAYIVSLFPCLSETFILREIEELTNNGFHISIFSLKPGKKNSIKHSSAVNFAKNAYYPHALLSLWFFISFIILHPIKLINLINIIIRENKSDKIFLLKSLYIVPRVLYFNSIIKKEKFEHIHAHWATIPTTAAWMINYISEIPYSFTAHAWDIWTNTKMLRRKIQEAKFTATISNFNKTLLSKNVQDVLHEKIKIVHCGIDVEKFKYSEPKPYEKLKIISVGRFVEKKGFIYLVNACKKLVDKGIDFHCTIVGDGPLWNEIYGQIKKMKIENKVELTGALPQDILKEKFRNSDLFVLPAIKASNGDLDGIPVVLMEAMALGIPVISTSVSGIPELIEHKQSGLLVDQKNVRQLTEAIETFQTFTWVNSNYAKLARQKIKNEFNIKKSAALMIDLIKA